MSHTWSFDQYDADTIKSIYWDFFHMLMLNVDGLSEKQAVNVINVVLSTCPSCYESNRSCQCWNDE